MGLEIRVLQPMIRFMLIIPSSLMHDFVPGILTVRVGSQISYSFRKFSFWDRMGIRSLILKTTECIYE